VVLIYGRADMPDSFAYDVAKALDEQKHLLIFGIIPLSYNPDIVWQARGVPLHKGAEQYYREKGQDYQERRHRSGKSECPRGPELHEHRQALPSDLSGVPWANWDVRRRPPATRL
jgi:hypothetical protein